MSQERADDVTRGRAGNGRYSRRHVLGGAGAAGLGLGLSACKVSTDSDDSGSAGQGNGQGNSHGGTSKKPEIVVPTSDAKLPTGKVKLGWMDSDDLKGMFEEPMFEEPMFEAYHKAHPNISINYDGTSWDRINESVPLGVRNGTAPDVFAIPNNVPVQVAVNEGWVAPIDDVVPDFEQWKANFPPTAFIPGNHIFNGRVYTWPMASSKRLSHLLMYDVGYLDRAGIDLSKDTLSWDGFRAACKKLTKQGDGNYFGLMLAGTAISGVATTLAELAGLRGGEFDWKTGEYNYTKPELREAIELLQSIKADGSLFPGGLGLGDADARARMPQRVAAMIFDGPWDIPKWPATNPGYKFGIGYPPPPDPDKPHHASYQEAGSNWVWLFAKSKHKQVVGDMFHYMGSLEGQTQLVTFSEGNLASLMDEANKRAAKTNKLSDHAVRAQEIADDLLRLAPMVEVRNPDASKVLLEQKPIKPSLVDICQGVFTGQVKDVGKALKSLQDDTNADFDHAIATARKKGAKVSRDDWAFPNWDPNKDYTKADYDKLPD